MLASNPVQRLENSPWNPNLTAHKKDIELTGHTIKNKLYEDAGW